MMLFKRLKYLLEFLTSGSMHSGSVSRDSYFSTLPLPGAMDYAAVARMRPGHSPYKDLLGMIPGEESDEDFMKALEESCFHDKNDLWIAAAAKVSGATVLTTDAKGFKPLRDGKHLDAVVLDPKTGWMVT